MTERKQAQNFSKSITYATIVALVIGFFFLRDYFSIIAVSLVLAYIYYPIYVWFKSRMSESAAVALTLIVNILSLLIPLALILVITVAQSKTIVDDVGGYVQTQSSSSVLDSILDPINNFLDGITGRNPTITHEDVTNKISEVASSLASWVLSTVTGWVSSLGSLITSIILYIYIFMSVLRHHKKLLSIVESLNPLGEKVTNEYLEKAGAMTVGMVRGQFIIAICQGSVSALILTLTGMPYGAFFALILSFLSLIPLGAGIVTIPIGIVRILMGDWWQGIVIILGHLLIVTNIDNVLRPLLVPKKAYINSALLLLSVFAGLGIFGFLGIIIGPIIMVLIVSTIDLYQSQQKADQKK